MALPEPANDAGTVEAEVVDAGEATAPGRLLARDEPQAVVLVAGAEPGDTAPISHR